MESVNIPDQRLAQFQDILLALKGVEPGEAGLRLSKSGKTLVLSVGQKSGGVEPLSGRWIDAYEVIEDHGFTVRNMVEEEGVLQIVARKMGES